MKTPKKPKTFIHGQVTSIFIGEETPHEATLTIVDGRDVVFAVVAIVRVSERLPVPR